MQISSNTILNPLPIESKASSSKFIPKIRNWLQRIESVQTQISQHEFAESGEWAAKNLDRVYLPHKCHIITHKCLFAATVICYGVDRWRRDNDVINEHTHTHIHQVRYISEAAKKRATLFVPYVIDGAADETSISWARNAVQIFSPTGFVFRIENVCQTLWLISLFDLILLHMKTSISSKACSICVLYSNAAVDCSHGWILNYDWRWNELFSIWMKLWKWREKTLSK